jgi:bacillithiol system protein YtxJ
MEWIQLKDRVQLNDLGEGSMQNCVLIFKHSNACSISGTVLNRLQRNWNDEEMPGVIAYLIDLHTHRDMSNAVAQQFGVPHESPQLILISRKEAVYNRSHFDINYADLRKMLNQAKTKSPEN